MSRSGYSDDCWGSELALWRGAVERALRGKRGQAFLKEMLAALDALPAPRLITEELELGGEVCAIGSVGKARGLDMSGIDILDRHSVAEAFGIAPAMVAEIAFMNDEEGPYNQTPEERFVCVKRWIEYQIKQ